MKVRTAFIRQRNDNYNVYIEYEDETGKIRQKSQGKYLSKKDAEKHLIEIKNSINNNKIIISKDITFVDRCIKYVTDESRDLSPTTLMNFKSCINTNIKPFFKDTQLGDITPSMLQAFANFLFKEYTQTSAKRRLGLAKAVLNESYRLREIKENPVAFIKSPKSLKADRVIADVYNKEEVKLIIEKLEGTSIEIPILLMLTMGLRSAEVSGLRWEDIDFKNNTISINQNLVYVAHTKIHLKDTKTQGSKRTISAPKELMVKLKKWKVQHNAYKLEGILEYEELVCLSTILSPVLNTTLIRTWYRFLDSNNIRRLRLHDLRHTHATMLILAGTDMKTVSDRLGHSDIKITMNRYSHVLEEMDRKASNNISEIMFK